MWVDTRAIAKEKANQAYGEVSEDIKDNIGLAYEWAVQTLTNHEGSGHDIIVSACYPKGPEQGLVQCSFAKPEWSGDHCGSGMETASEAIVMSVCEYLNGC